MFGPCAAAIWALQIHKPEGWTGWVILVSVVQLGLGEYARRRMFGSPMTITSGRLRWALAALVILQGAQWSLSVHPLGPMPAIATALGQLLYMMVLVGYVEELWFRGLWLRALSRFPLTGLLSGSLIFALYHWPQGGHAVLLTFSIGMVYGAARLRGAPILALGLGHGLVNWLNDTALPPVALRVETELALLLFPLICLAGAFALLIGAPRPPRS